MTQAAVVTRKPQAGTWQVDPAHSSVTFWARHLMVTKVRGRFGDFASTIHIDQDPAASWAETTIQAASIDTANQMRDGHLRSPDFLDVERHPTITFRSSGLEVTGEDTFRLSGHLMIRGVERPVTLDVELVGLATDTQGGTRAAFSAKTEIDRDDWDITWNQVLETGGVVVGRKVTIELDVQAVLQA